MIIDLDTSICLHKLFGHVSLEDDYISNLLKRLYIIRND